MLADPVKPETIRPILKWAGGKRQLIPELIKHVPSDYGQYIEPFLGGGALYFHLQPKLAVIADSNTEIINLYRVIANDTDKLVNAMQSFQNDEDNFYAQRALDPRSLSKVDAAARTLYLNRTCFNGLYRVNKKGDFNVPFGKYVNPTICDEQALRRASSLLANSKIEDGDYATVLRQHAKPGDFIFLDPPYVPVSLYSDFKRYTKEQFGEKQHIKLAEQVKQLHENGCHILLTNSDSELVMDLYKQFTIDVVATKRNINSKGNKRTGKDVIISAGRVKTYKSGQISEAIAAEQIAKFPPTRFMGSKNKVLTSVRDAILSQPCETVLDLFSGSGVVSYMLKAHGKSVISNDYMAFSSLIGKALIENNSTTLPLISAKELLQPNLLPDDFVVKNYEGLYFTAEENRLIDDIRANIKLMDNEFQQAIATSALVRACFKKRPRGIFTYVGQRYDDGRKDLQTTLADHFLLAVDALNNAVFDNGKINIASRADALGTDYKPDLVYLDPPYYSPHSDNDYVRRYHFVEGIACDWRGVEMQWKTKTRKFKNYPTPFSTKKGTHRAFEQLFAQFSNSTIVVSYSSNSQPTKTEMLDMLNRYKANVEVVSVEHRYSFGNQAHKVNDNKNAVSEYLFIAS